MIPVVFKELSKTLSQTSVQLQRREAALGCEGEGLRREVNNPVGCLVLVSHSAVFR